MRTHLSSFLFVVLCTASLDAADGEKKAQAEKTVDGEMLVKWNGIYFYDLQTQPFSGRAVSRFPSGEIRYEAHLKAGKPHGAVAIYFQSGKKQFEGYYEKGLRHGIETNWHLNGNKHFQVNYRSGKRHGKMTWWRANGLKEMEVFFVNGLRDGPFSLYDENGQILSKRIYKNGKLVSPRPATGKDADPTEDDSNAKILSDILPKQKFRPESHNNPEFPKWEESTGRLVMTSWKKKNASGWVWLKEETQPPFEISLEYQAKPHRKKGKTTRNSGMAILFCKNQNAEGIPDTRKTPGFLKDGSGYALLFGTAGKGNGFRLLDATGKILGNTKKENTHSNGNWKKVELRVQPEAIHLYWENKLVFSHKDPDLEDKPGGIAIIATNTQIPCEHSIRNFTLKTWQEEKPETDPAPPLPFEQEEIYTVGYAHLELKGGIRYETGQEKPFSGKAIDFYENGQKKLEYRFKEGRHHGISSFWYPNGQKAVHKIYIEGVPVDGKKWTEDGTMVQ